MRKLDPSQTQILENPLCGKCILNEMCKYKIRLDHLYTEVKKQSKTLPSSVHTDLKITCAAGRSLELDNSSNAININGGLSCNM